MSLNHSLDCVAGLGMAILIYTGISATPVPVRARQSEPRVVEVVARKFAFDPPRIEVTEGETVRLMVRSADGVHGVGIKKFKVSEEVPRGGTPVIIEFTANAAGEFEILCSEYCGKGHEEMAAMLVVKARAR
jgi:cytochrome c oxidase subunit 2